MAATDTKRGAETMARRAEREEWIDDVLASDLQRALKVLAVRIARYRNDFTGQCNPSVDTLARRTGKHGKWARRTVQRQLKALRKLGWITYTDNRGGRSKSTQYTLTKPRHLDVALSSPPNRDTQSTKPRHTEFKTATPRSRTNLRSKENLTAGADAERDDNSRPRPPTFGRWSTRGEPEQPYITNEQPTKQQMEQNFASLFADLRSRSREPK
jgi:hypothetical protein